MQINLKHSQDMATWCRERGFSGGRKSMCQGREVRKSVRNESHVHRQNELFQLQWRLCEVSSGKQSRWPGLRKPGTWRVLASCGKLRTCSTRKGHITKAYLAWKMDNLEAILKRGPEAILWCKRGKLKVSLSSEGKHTARGAVRGLSRGSDGRAGISDKNRRGRTTGSDSRHYASGAIQTSHKLDDLGQVALKLKDLMSFSVGIIAPPHTHDIRM